MNQFNFFNMANNAAPCKKIKENSVRQIYHFLSSRTLALPLFGVLIAGLIPKTLIKEQFLPLNLTINVTLVLIGVNLLFCTIRRFQWISKPVLLIHIGFLVTLAGGALSWSGFVATVNIHEGSTTETAYRWDRESDSPLGFSLEVKEIHTNYYPFGVKVGVLKNGEKSGLFPLKTDQSFTLDRFRVMVSSLDFSASSLNLFVFEDDRLLGAYSTGGASDLPADFPYDFKLVAFQDPVLKRVWTDISILRNNTVVAEGTAEVNHPFKWEGLRFYNTQIDNDDTGAPYAGIQIVKDPGIPYIYAGFIIICLGAVFQLGRLSMKGRRKT